MNLRQIYLNCLHTPFAGPVPRVTLATAAVSTDSFTAAYEKPTTGSGTALEDTAGKEVASFNTK